MTEMELQAAFPTITRLVHIARGALRRLRPHVLEADARAHVEKLKEYEPFRRTPSEHSRVYHEIHEENTRSSRRAASIAMHYLNPASQHVRDWRRLVESMRRDVSLSMPQAMVGVTPDGMLMAALLRDQRRTAIMNMSVDQLSESYSRALATKDAAAYIDAELIEQVVLGGTGLALEAQDLSKLKQLREYVEAVQDLRVPTDLPPYEELAADIDALNVRADLLGISGMRPDLDPAADAEYRAQEETLLEIGSASDRDDIAAMHAELSKAAGQ